MDTYFPSITQVRWSLSDVDRWFTGLTMTAGCVGWYSRMFFHFYPFLDTSLWDYSCILGHRAVLMAAMNRVITYMS